MQVSVSVQATLETEGSNIVDARSYHLCDVPGGRLRAKHRNKNRKTELLDWPGTPRVDGKGDQLAVHTWLLIVFSVECVTVGGS